MIDLYTYISEGVLNNIEDTLANSDNNIIAVIKEFINSNYNCCSRLTISKQPNSDGKYIVDAKNSEVRVKTTTHTNIISLTNNLFVWCNVKSFSCTNCNSLKSLEGAPKKCDEFYCNYCDSLKSLEGAPIECNGFYCNDCNSLKSLEGAPTKCNRFSCCNCNSLTSLEGAPTKCDEFYCYNCNSLKTLKGAPTKCNKFYCNDCKSLTSLEGAPKNCKIISDF